MVRDGVTADVNPASVETMQGWGWQVADKPAETAEVPNSAPNGEAVALNAATALDLNSATVPQMRDELKRRGIAFAPGASKAMLVQLLSA